jgi:hypothetical protein
MIPRANSRPNVVTARGGVVLRDDRRAVGAVSTVKMGNAAAHALATGASAQSQVVLHDGTLEKQRAIPTDAATAHAVAALAPGAPLAAHGLVVGHRSVDDGEDPRELATQATGSAAPAGTAESAAAARGQVVLDGGVADGHARFPADVEGAAHPVAAHPVWDSGAPDGVIMVKRATADRAVSIEELDGAADAPGGGAIRIAVAADGLVVV